MNTTAYCKDTVTVPITGAGTAGAHTNTVVLPPGRYSITLGGTVGGATTTCKLRDAAGNLFDIPNPASSGAAALPGSYPVEFTTPGATLVIATTGAGGSTAQTCTVGPIH